MFYNLLSNKSYNLSYVMHFFLKALMISSLCFAVSFTMASEEVRADDSLDMNQLHEKFEASIEELRNTDKQDVESTARIINAQIELFDASKIGIGFKSRKYSRATKLTRTTKLLALKNLLHQIQKSSDEGRSDDVEGYTYRCIAILESILDT